VHALLLVLGLMMLSPLELELTSWLDDVWRRAIRPAGELTISQWADRYRYVSARGSSEAGPWKTERTPYLREIMDELSPSSPARVVVLQKATRLGGTECGNNWLGYIIHHNPAPTMLVLPTRDMGRGGSRQRLDPLFSETPVLRPIVGPTKTRDASNSTFSKDFPGGFLLIKGANSAAALRADTVKYIFLDEVDAYPTDVDGEGDPVTLAVKRADTFPDAKIFMVSSPKAAGTSRVERWLLRSDQRHYLLPCPHCGHAQRLVWSNVVWATVGLSPDDACYACERCGALWTNEERIAALPRGHWQATATGEPDIVGFHLSGLYSPWRSLGAHVREYLEIGDSESLRRVFGNTVLGESYRLKGDAPNWRRLYDNREDYDIGTVPRGGLVLTAGADVQRNRIEVLVKAWGPRMESWVVDYLVIQEDPGSLRCWEAMTELLYREWPTEVGSPLRIQLLAVDSGGHFTPYVYEWTSHHKGKAIAIKGVDDADRPLYPATLVDIRMRDGRRVKRGAQLFKSGVTGLKGMLYDQLELEAPLEPGEPFPDGFHHHPGFSDDWFKQLTAEEQVVVTKRSGAIERRWRLTYHRNEVLDCSVYAMACAYGGLKLQRYEPGEWLELAKAKGALDGQPQLALEEPPPGAADAVEIVEVDEVPGAAELEPAPVLAPVAASIAPMARGKGRELPGKSRLARLGTPQAIESDHPYLG
jgi:phage terminase large subunit GpA-like protein